MTRLALDPPSGVRVAAVFIIGRQPANASSDAFYSYLIPQLALIAGLERVVVPPDVQSRGTWFGQLLELAAARAAVQGERLLILVDGLDEDQGPLSADPKQSVAASIPAILPPNVRVVITSRGNPPLPSDVDERHPLRSVRRRLLEPSPAATAAERRAMDEIDAVLDAGGSDRYGRDALAFIAASGSELSTRDLAALTGRTPREFERLLGTATGRSFSVTALPDGTRAYSLGHDMIDRALVTGHLDLPVQAPGPDPSESDLARYSRERFQALAPWREHLARWGRDWAGLGWPAESPGYLLSAAFPAMLSADPELQDEAVAVVCDERRVERLTALHHGEHEVMQQLEGTARLLHENWIDADHSLLRIAEVLRRLHRLTARNAVVPHELPAVHAGLGRVSRAMGLARSQPEPWKGVGALRLIADELLRYDAEGARVTAHEALEAARGLSSEDRRCVALTEVALLLERMGEAEAARIAIRDALAEARTIRYPFTRGSVLVEISDLLLGAGKAAAAGEAARLSVEAAHELAGAGEHRLGVEHLLINAVQTLLEAGETEVALREIRAIADPSVRAPALARAASVLADRGQAAQAASLTDEMLRELDAIHHDFYRAAAIRQVAPILVESGQAEAGLSMALAVKYRPLKVGALIRVALALNDAGAVEEALVVALQARSTAEAIPDEFQRSTELVEVAPALAAIGETGLAIDLLDGADRGHYSPDAFVETAQAIARKGDVELALGLARRIPYAADRIRALAIIARILLDAKSQGTAAAVADEALVAAGEVTQDYRRGGAIIAALPAAVRVQEAETVLAVVRGMADEAHRSRAFAAAANGFAACGKRDAAVIAMREALGELAPSDASAEALLSDVPRMLFGSEDELLDDSDAFLDRWDREQIALALAPALARLGRRTGAMELARAIGDRGRRSRVFAGVAIAAPVGSDTAAVAREEALADALEELRPRDSEAPTEWSDRMRCEAMLVLVELGEIGSALEAADSLGSDLARARVFAGVALGMAGQGDGRAPATLLDSLDLLDDSLQWARTMEPDHDRDTVFSDLAQGLMLAADAVSALDAAASSDGRSQDLRERIARLLAGLWIADRDPWWGWGALASLAPRTFPGFIALAEHSSAGPPGRPPE